MKIFSAQLKGTTTVATGSNVSLTGSFSGSIAGIDINGTNTFTGSTSNRLNSIETISASNISRINSLETISASNIARLNSLEATSASVITLNSTQNDRLNSLETTSASVNTLNTFQSNRLNSLEDKTGSLATTGSNTFYGTQVFTGSVYITQNLIVQGSSSLQNITGSSVNIGTNTVVLNTTNPAVRYGGISIIDSGSTGLTGSILWDSTNNNWLYQNPSGSSYTSAKFISGPQSATLGNEPNLINNYIVKAVGDDHISSSAIYDDGSKISLKSNTEISGTLKVSTYTSSFNGNVGIGTSTPAGKLEVWQSAGNRLVIDYVNIGNEPRISSLDASGNPQYLTLNSYDLKINANGTEALRVTELGKVGIGTTNPKSYSVLTINGQVISLNNIGVDINQSFRLNNYYNSGTTSDRTISTGYAASVGLENTIGALLFNISSVSASVDTNITTTERMRISKAGYVGIGTTNPGNLLDIYGGGLRVKTGAGSSFVTIDKGSGVGSSSQIYFIDQGTSKWDIGAFYIGAAGADDFSLYNRNTSLNALTVLYSTGAVGVGVTSPQSQFVVGKSGNNASVEINLNNNGYGRIFAYDRGTATGLNLVLNDPGGNVGIGITNPSAKLHIMGTSTYLHIGNTDDSRYVDLGHWVAGRTTMEIGGGDLFIKTQQTNYLALGTASSERMRILSNGNIGIGTTSPGTKLHVEGQVYATSGFSTNAALTGNGAVHGNISSNITGNLAYCLLTRLDVDSGWITRGTVVCASWTCWNVSDIYIRKAYASTSVSATITGVAKGGGQDFAIVDCNYGGQRWLAFKFSGGNGEVDVSLTGFGQTSSLQFVSSVSSENSILASY